MFLQTDPVYGSDETPSLTRIIINGDSVLLITSDLKDQDLLSRQNIILDYRNNNIAFEFSFVKAIDYQYFLEGFDKEWTPWKRTNYKEYTNLPAGHYMLRVKYRGPDIKDGEIPVFRV